MKWSQYRKLYVALIGALVIAATQFGGDALGETVTRYATSIEAFLVSLGVWGVPNAD